MVTGKANGRRFEGRRRVASSKECEGSPNSKEGKRSPGRRRVAGAIWSGYRCVSLRRRAEASPLSLIGNGGLGFFCLLFVFFFFFACNGSESFGIEMFMVGY